MKNGHHKRFLTALAILIGIGCLAVLSAAHWYLKAGDALAFELRPPTAQELAKAAEYEKLVAGGVSHKPLSRVVDYPGITAPKMMDANAVDLPDSTEIVGVEINGEFRAFVLNAMLSPREHIINLVVDECPLSVTYCNLVDCVRVLTRAGDGPIPLNVGGMDQDNQMVFLLEGARYGQASPGLPLIDHPFNRTTWGEWNGQHPTTRVYLGNR